MPEKPVIPEPVTAKVPCWLTNTRYFRGDIVCIYRQAYRCTDDHVSNIFAQDLHRLVWKKIDQ